MYQFWRVLARGLFSIFHPTKIYGRENLKEGKAILSINHRSNWDIVLWLANNKMRFKILAKKELFSFKPFGAFLRWLGGIEIDRSGNDINAIKNCMKALKDGKKLVVFPEGTRLKNEADILGEIKSGLALIAIKTKTPIIPIWIERKPKIFRFSKYHIGEAFELESFYDKKLDEETLGQANQVVREKMLEVRAEVLKEKEEKNKKKKRGKTE